MSASGASFAAAIDRRHEASRSVVLRYRRALRFLPDEDENARYTSLLEGCSVREGVRIVPLLEHRGVALDVLDETSCMLTGTLKSIDGCVTSAWCLFEGVRRVVFETGGNTGAALAEYGARAGLESFCFVPRENLPLLASETFARPETHLVAVEEPGLVRPAAERFAELYGLVRVPRREWRVAASRFLGCFLLESLLDGQRVDWLVQTISAGFAPIGIYDVLAAHGLPDAARGAPRFLGVQQAANCTMFRAWRAGSPDVEPEPVRSTARLLSPVMYDSRPLAYGTFERLRGVLERTDGDLTTIDEDEFARTLASHPAGSRLLDRLAEEGISITVRDGRVVERTGLIALAGALREIDSGRIAAGSRVLCCLTSGTGRPDGRAVPELTIGDLATLEREAARRWPRAAAAHG